MEPFGRSTVTRKVKTVFSKLESGGPSLRAAANQLGLGVVEITADNPSKIGILANASMVLVDHGIGIRQALVGDPELNPELKLTLNRRWGHRGKGHSADS